MPPANCPRIILKVVLAGIVIVAAAQQSIAGETWGSITETQAPVVIQPVQPVRPLWPRAKPLFPAGYAGTTYPPLGTRWRAMRANYAYAQATPGGWFAKFKKTR